MTVHDSEAKLIDFLIEDYDHWKYRTVTIQAFTRQRGYKPAPIAKSQTNKKLFADMAAWCAKHQVEPRWFLYCLFRTKAFMTPPTRQPDSLMKASVLQHARITSVPEAFKQRIRDTAPVIIPRAVFHPNIAIPQPVERFNGMGG